MDLTDKPSPQGKRDSEINYDALWQYFQDGGRDIWNESESLYLGSLDPGPQGGDYIIEVNGPKEYGIDFCKDRDDLPRLVQDFVRYGGTVSSIKKALQAEQATSHASKKIVDTSDKDPAQVASVTAKLSR